MARRLTDLARPLPTDTPAPSRETDSDPNLDVVCCYVDGRPLEDLLPGRVDLDLASLCTGPARRRRSLFVLFGEARLMQPPQKVVCERRGAMKAVRKIRLA